MSRSDLSMTSRGTENYPSLDPFKLLKNDRFTSRSLEGHLDHDHFRFQKNSVV